ncbi:MAG: hypothetical protein MK171_05220 [Pirellulales bacterium]|nr:hypothetical protein [Pirellulales bacterium]
MPISVTCPGCHTRFSVGDQHGGKTGACPKCKGPIEIPKAGDEVVIHAPELEAGAKDARGRSVLKPIKRKEATLSVNVTVAVVCIGILALAVAWLFGRSDLGDARIYALAGGAALLGPLLAYAGYTFLRDDELGVYQGTTVLVRSLACGLVYALLWGIYWYLGSQLFANYAEGLNTLQIIALGLFVLGVGTFAALVCFDLEVGTAFFHCALYFLITVGLRFVMNLPLVPGM